MHDLVVLQLAFNVLILAALCAVLRGPRRRAAEAAPRRRRWFARRAKAPAPAVAAAPVAAAAPALADLVERAEQQELLAEAALRDRLARFRARAS
ncbi:MAG: hypothetical protein KBD01_02960 [Acidobacteria bacterium]|nr:hypothetical protein [Acidobacteriota bacterium]